jgi:hypothetical protein
VVQRKVTRSKATKDTHEQTLSVAFVSLGELAQLIAGLCSYWADDDVGLKLAGKILQCKWSDEALIG